MECTRRIIGIVKDGSVITSSELNLDVLGFHTVDELATLVFLHFGIQNIHLHHVELAAPEDRLNLIVSEISSIVPTDPLYFHVVDIAPTPTPNPARVPALAAPLKSSTLKAISISGACGPSSSQLNGIYCPMDMSSGGFPVYKHFDFDDYILEYFEDESRKQWHITRMKDRGKSLSFAYSSVKSTDTKLSATRGNWKEYFDGEWMQTCIVVEEVDAPSTDGTMRILRQHGGTCYAHAATRYSKSLLDSPQG